MKNIQSKSGQKLLNQVVIKYNVADILGVFENEQIPLVVKMLDENSEDWCVTEACFLYFADQIIKGLEEDKDEDEPLFDKKVYSTIKKLYDKV